MTKIIWVTKERNNAKKVAEIKPYAIYHNMLHSFSRVQKPHHIFLASSDIFTKYFMQQPFVELIFKKSEYNNQNPQTMVLWHGIIYKALFDLYMKYTTISFDNYYLSKEQYKYTTDRQQISSSEYKKLPRKYRQLFTINKYKDVYILNNYMNDIKIDVKKSQRVNVEHLLARARRLIPTIYHEPTPDIFMGALQIFESAPYVYSSSNRIKDEQLQAINELHDIFVEISKITFPLRTSLRDHDILNEYYAEQYQHNIVYKVKNGLNELKGMLKESLVPVKINKGKEIIKAKDVKRVLNRPKTIENKFFTHGQRYKFARRVFIDKLHFDLETYTR